MLKSIVEWFAGTRDHLHPEHVVCAELAKKEPNLDLKFIAYTRSASGRYVTPEEGGKEVLTYIPVAANGKLQILYNKILTSEFEEFGLAPETSLRGHEHLKIPMIDFVKKPTENDFKVFAHQLGNFISCLKGCKLFIFSSGNSYHGYVDGLLSKSWYKEYKHFLGSVPFVDQWWVAKGMVCLRWSKPPRWHGRKVPQLVYTMDI